MSLVAALLLAPAAAHAQAMDLSQGGPVTVTAAGGIDWDQKSQTVTAYQQARAIRGNVTVDADRLIAYYRKKQTPAGQAAPGAAAATAGAPASSTPAAGMPGAGTPASSIGTASADAAAGTAPVSGAPDDTGSNEIYRLKAIGNVHIYTATDQAWGDQALYDIDQSVLVLTGHALKLITPTDTITARDSLEYWPQKRMSVARGDAILTTSDGRRIAADILVGYSAPNAPANGAAGKGSGQPQVQNVSAVGQSGSGQSGSGQGGGDALASSGKLKKAEAYGDVVVRTQTETVRGERGVYVTDTGIARIIGNVRITRGQNQLNGQAAIVDMRTGIATMTEDPGDRVQGLIVPNDNTGAQPGAAGKPGAAKPARPAGHAAHQTGDHA